MDCANCFDLVWILADSCDLVELVWILIIVVIWFWILADSLDLGDLAWIVLIRLIWFGFLQVPVIWVSWFGFY